MMEEGRSSMSVGWGAVMFEVVRDWWYLFKYWSCSNCKERAPAKEVEQPKLNPRKWVWITSGNCFWCPEAFRCWLGDDPLLEEDEVDEVAEKL